MGDTGQPPPPPPRILRKVLTEPSRQAGQKQAVLVEGRESPGPVIGKGGALLPQVGQKVTGSVVGPDPGEMGFSSCVCPPAAHTDSGGLKQPMPSSSKPSHEAFKISSPWEIKAGVLSAWPR